MKSIELASMAVGGLALASLSLALAIAEPKAQAPGSVCMVAPVQEASKEGWVCGHPVAEVDDASKALLRKPVHTGRGDFVGNVVSVVRAENGKVESIVVSPQVVGSASAMILIDANDVLVLEEPSILITTLSVDAFKQAHHS